ncbi:MAG: diacylglycerol kinase family protein [Clostridia bacterium]
MYDIIINPIAGKGKSIKAYAMVESELTKRGITYTAHFTKRKNHASQIVAELNSRDKHTNLIVMGGDGTYNETLNGITDFAKITVGFIPCGTGNDFVRPLKLPKNPIDNLKIILDGKSRYLDFIALDEKRALNCAGAGMDVDILLRYAKIKFFKGKLKYYIALLQSLINLKFHKMELTIDGETQVREVFIMAIANGTHIGGGMPISPRSKLDDKMLDLVIINRVPKAKVIPLLLKFLKGKHIDEPCTECHSGKEFFIRMLSEDGVSLKTQVDGEVFDSCTLNCKIVSDTLHIFTN